MMFVDRYRTKFSISDNGIGLKKSLDTKVFFPFYYSKDEFRNSLEKKETKFSPVFIENLIDIFEALFYSSIKEREGIFDLMLNVVLNSQGYFRLHTDNCQIIVTNRIFKYLSSLQKIRASILYTHKLNENTELDNSIYKKDIVEYKNQIKKLFAKMLSVTIDYYSEETQFSSIRFFNVKFKGVHIEVEIPNR